MLLTNDTPIKTFDPASLDYEKAAAFLPQRALGQTSEDYEGAVLRLIEDNDFWQENRRYVGPRPASGEGFLAGMQLIQQSFAPISKLREVLRRHVRGVIGREPQFEIVVNPDAKKQPPWAREADTVQGAVWDERGEHVIAQSFARHLRATGKAYLRYDVPPGLLVEGADRVTGEPTTGVSASSWQDGYRLLYMELAPRDSANIHTDRATMRQTAFYSYEEPLPGDAEKTRKCVQISWLGDDGLTRVRVVRDKGESEDWSVDTGGRLLVIEASMEPLLTPDLLRLQDIVSSVATMIKINGDVAGFPEVTAIDLESPSSVVDDPDRPGEKTEQRDEVVSGPRTQKFMYSYGEVDGNGQPALDVNQRPVVRQGSLHYREPVSSAPLRDDADWFEKQIYLAVNQEHIVARRSSTVSAEALLEMRADYADSLLETKPHVEKALREAFHARLCAAADLAGDAGTLAQLKAARVRVDVQMNAGPLTTTEKADIITRYEKRLLSRETAMVMLGTEDIDAEVAKIKADESEEFSDGFPAKEVEDGQGTEEEPTEL